MTVQAALIRGGMYDLLYPRLKVFTQSTGTIVETPFLGDHPALNAHLSEFREVPYDLVSTHTKYAPSQTELLAPLDDLIAPEELADFVPLLLDLARIDGKLYGLPRNIDVRLLHYRTDLIHRLPESWDDLQALAREVNQPPQFYGFIFPGTESGLFGTFFELAEMGGSKLFPEDLVPQIENEGGRWALSFLRTCYVEGLVPPEIVGWHYDAVHDTFRAGRAAMIGDWPGYYKDYCDPTHSEVSKRFSVARYPPGPLGFPRVYGGGHTFALTKKGASNPEALALLGFLTAPEQQILEARNGSVPVRSSIMKQVQTEATPVEKERWETLEKVIGQDVLIPPKFPRYPEVEEVLWKTVQLAMTDRLEMPAALNRMTRQIRAIIADPHGR